MKICFLDIETVPTDRSLEENGLLGPQMQLDEAERIKKLSLSAATAKMICLGYAIEPPVGALVAASKLTPRSVDAFCRIARVVGFAAT